MPAEPSRDAWDAGDLDIDHLASLANLPLDEGEQEDLEAACREVLEAFGLEAVEDTPADQPPVATFEDEAWPWPEEELALIHAAFPSTDGGYLSP